MRAFAINQSASGRWTHYWALALRGATLVVGCLGAFCAQVLAVPSFQDAVADYNGGHYASAVGKFEAVEASYPSNALVHYYMALSQQAVGHINQAKAEYQWVIQSRDPKLAPQAATGLAQLAGVRTTGSGGSSASPSVHAVSASGASGGGGGQKIAMGKVKKVIEFWATW